MRTASSYFRASGITSLFKCRLSTEPTSTARRLTTAEAEALLGNLQGRYLYLVALLLVTGMRVGEASRFTSRILGKVAGHFEFSSRCTASLSKRPKRRMRGGNRYSGRVCAVLLSLYRSTFGVSSFRARAVGPYRRGTSFANCTRRSKTGSMRFADFGM